MGYDDFSSLGRHDWTGGTTVVPWWTEIMAEILKELEQVVTEIGKAEKFTLILERSQILYSDQATDITSRVIEVYNSRVKK